MSYTYRTRFYGKNVAETWPKVAEAIKDAFPDPDDFNPTYEHWRKALLKDGALEIKSIEESSYSIAFDVNLPNEGCRDWFCKLYHYFLMRTGLCIED